MTKPDPLASQDSHASVWPRSALAWPAWLRVLAVMPALVSLWLGVAWASQDIFYP